MSKKEILTGVGRIEMKTTKPPQLIKKILKKWDLKKVELAQLGGWSIRNIYRWYDGDTQPHDRNLLDLWRIYNWGPVKFTERFRGI